MQILRKRGMITVPIDNDNEEKHQFLYSSLYETIAGRTDYFIKLLLQQSVTPVTELVSRASQLSFTI
jgi:hypothetical protein